MLIGKRNRKRMENAKNRANHIEWALNLILSGDPEVDEHNCIAHLYACLRQAQRIEGELELAIEAAKKREGLKR